MIKMKMKDDARMITPIDEIRRRWWADADDDIDEEDVITPKMMMPMMPPMRAINIIDEFHW